MISISIFNNKGGVGKTTLTFHLAHALAATGKRVLMIDADPQCNLTLYSLDQETILEMWDAEDEFFDDYGSAIEARTNSELDDFFLNPRTLHFYLKPAEDGVAPITRSKVRPYKLRANLHLLPGRLSFHSFEEQLVINWDSIFSGKPIGLRLATSIRELASQANVAEGYDYAIIDTSPSLGRLNRLIISTSDVFIVPCMPDMFSLYGIKNIGNALKAWKAEYKKLVTLLQPRDISKFPEEPAKFAGYVIVNARKRSDSKNEWKLAKAAYRYAQLIPEYIKKYVPEENKPSFKKAPPLGGTAVMHSHATMPSVSQNHHVPMWEVPETTTPKDDDYFSIMGSRVAYEATLEKYTELAEDLMKRIRSLKPNSD